MQTFIEVEVRVLRAAKEFQEVKGKYPGIHFHPTDSESEAIFCANQGDFMLVGPVSIEDDPLPEEGITIPISAIPKNCKPNTVVQIIYDSDEGIVAVTHSDTEEIFEFAVLEYRYPNFKAVLDKVEAAIPVPTSDIYLKPNAIYGVVKGLKILGEESVSFTFYGTNEFIRIQAGSFRAVLMPMV